jgi:hypothetical protein
MLEVLMLVRRNFQEVEGDRKYALLDKKYESGNLEERSTHRLRQGFEEEPSGNNKFEGVFVSDARYREIADMYRRLMQEEISDGDRLLERLLNIFYYGECEDFQGDEGYIVYIKKTERKLKKSELLELVDEVTLES